MITLFDGILGSFYFLIIMLIGWVYSNQKKGQGKLNYKYYLPSLFIHLFGVTFFCLVYGFYYGGGDSYYYFRGGASLNKYLLTNPFETLSVYFYSLENIPTELSYIISWIGKGNSEETFLSMKIASIFSLIGGGGFLSASIILSYLSFFFNWKLFTTINKAFYIEKVNSPKLHYILFIPSLFFWGTGILKDTYVFIFSSIIIIIFIQAFNIKGIRFLLLKLFLLVVSSYCIISLKPYVFFSVLGSLLVAYYGKILSTSRLLKSNKALGYIFNFIFLMVLIGILFYGFQSFQSEILRAQNEAIKTLQGFHDWHTKLGGSSYSLGITDYSIFGILQQSPLAFLVTYFGPFPWQINSPIMLLTALESYFYLYLFVIAIRTQRFQLFSLFKKHNIILFSIIFSIVFGILVGITSYNYGALARFKIQALPYFLIWLSSYKSIKR